MIIRKTFKFEGAHIVRDCSTERCKSSIHGHSYKVEIFFTASRLDYGQMILDFSLIKKVIGDFMDSFDHTYVFWDREKPEFKQFIKENNKRWIKLPVSPSAEQFALLILHITSRLFDLTQFGNGEWGVEVVAVRVHETETGYAEARVEDEDLDWVHYTLDAIEFSEGVKEDWKNKNWWNDLKQLRPIYLEKIERKYI